MSVTTLLSSSSMWAARFQRSSLRGGRSSRTVLGLGLGLGCCRDCSLTAGSNGLSSSKSESIDSDPEVLASLEPGFKSTFSSSSVVARLVFAKCSRMASTPLSLTNSEYRASNSGTLNSLTEHYFRVNQSIKIWGVDLCMLQIACWWAGNTSRSILFIARRKISRPLQLCDWFCNGWDALWDGLGRGWVLCRGVGGSINFWLEICRPNNHAVWTYRL